MVTLAKFITNLGGFEFITCATIILFLLVKNKKQKLLIVANISISAILNILLKNIFQRPRPALENRLIEEVGYSFPSGHSMGAMTFYGYLIYLTYKYIKNNYLKWSLIALLSLVIIFIGSSRIILGVHYISDVIGGFCISLLYLTIFINCTKKYMN